ncbi:hypothetical protein KRMM14A1259_45230 [Krasilnikovia sp. MM14-A1259]
MTLAVGKQAAPAGDLVTHLKDQGIRVHALIMRARGELRRNDRPPALGGARYAMSRPNRNGPRTPVADKRSDSELCECDHEVLGRLRAVQRPCPAGKSTGLGEELVERLAE